MPAKPTSKQRSAEKRKAKARAISSVATSPVAAPATQPVNQPQTVKPRASPVTQKESLPSYAYVAGELKRIAVVTGIVLAILIILAIFLR